MTSGVARSTVDLAEYRRSLKIRMQESQKRIRDFISSYKLNL
jgi:malate dehydrogenase (oxaloacetate-decarboxylating)(NADP+)